MSAILIPRLVGMQILILDVPSVGIRPRQLHAKRSAPTDVRQALVEERGPILGVVVAETDRKSTIIHLAIC